MSTLKRLLGSLHEAVFDTSPDKGIAFFVRHPDGVSWAVSEEKLTATVNGYSKTYDLSQFTVGQLAGQMTIDGFQVANLQPEFAGLSASVLLEGSGNTRDSNGDRLYAFRDLLRALFGGYARELRAAKAAKAEALKQMVITQAEAEWLNLWGALYNTPRPAGMTDAKYQPLIPAEAFRLRVNGYAIEKAIFDLTGQVVHIEEPWNDMFRLDSSRLSSLHKFYDGNSIGPHLIRPVADQAIDWTGILDIIERNKAGGVLVLPPEERNRTWIKDPLAGIIWRQRTDLWSRLIRYTELPRLSDNLYLSDYEAIQRNFSVAITSLQMVSGLLDKVNGRIWAAPSHILGFYGELPHDQKVMPYHSAYNKPHLIQAYPDTKKTWRSGGKWSGRQSWAKPYEWKIYARSTQYGRGMIVDATINGTTWLDISSGADWTVPKTWSSMSWQGLREQDAVAGSWAASDETWGDQSWETPEWNSDDSWDDIETSWDS